MNERAYFDANHLRMLTMDGGPSPLVQIHLLRHLEGLCPGFLERTQFFAGTSDGALHTLFLAAELHRGRTGAEALANAVDYSKELLRCLDTTLWGMLRFGFGCRPLLDVEPLRKLLRRDDVLGRLTLGDLAQGAVGRQVMVVSFDAFHWMPHYFRNFEPFCTDQREAEALSTSLVDAALASSAFPLYLPLHFGPKGRHTIDGGMVANNPSLCALVSAARMRQHQRDPARWTPLRDGLDGIQMLSFGASESSEERRATVRPPTSEYDGPLPPKPEAWGSAVNESDARARDERDQLRKDNWPQEDIRWGWYQWLLRRPLLLLNTMLQAPTKAATQQCSELLGPHFQRFQPPMGEIATGIRMALDPPEKVQKMVDQRVKALTASANDPLSDYGQTIAWVKEHWMPQTESAP